MHRTLLAVLVIGLLLVAGVTTFTFSQGTGQSE